MIDVLREGPKNTSEISEILDIDEGLVVLNLNQLKETALVRREEPESEKRYSLNKETLEPLSEVLSFHTQKYCPRLTQCIPPEKLKAYMKTEAAKETYIQHE
jgi:predicted transcriptional regulator